MRYHLSDRGRVGLVSFSLFCLALFLTNYSAKNQGVSAVGYTVLAEIVSPFSRASDGILGEVTRLWNNYVALWTVREENEQLRARLQVLETQNSELVEIQKETNRLRSLLAIREQVQGPSVAGTVIGYDALGWSRAVMIDRGMIDGVSIGDPVVEGNGVVGQVIAVSPNTSRVLLLIDRKSAIDGLVQDNRARGIVEGTSGTIAEFRYVNEGDDVRLGDKVVTSGLDGVFPKGIIIGVVSKVSSPAGGLFKEVQVTPSARFSKLENVLVMKRNRKEAP